MMRVVITTLTLAAAMAAAQEIDIDPSTQHSYLYAADEQNFVGAVRSCRLLGGNLASITSAQENAFVTSLITVPEPKPLIGATDLRVEGEFRWIDGEPFDFTSWKEGEPNDLGSGEDFIEISDEGLWNDISLSSNTRPYVCEWDRPVASVSACFEVEGRVIDQAVVVIDADDGTQVLTTSAQGCYFAVIPVSGASLTITVPSAAKLFTGNGHIFEAFVRPNEEPIRWQSARAACEQRAGYLATLTSAAENAFVTDTVLIANRPEHWLGATDLAEEGVFEWVTGEPFDYTNWADGEPNDNCSGSTEDYLGIRANGMWNDLPNRQGCAFGQAYVCEYETPRLGPVNGCFHYSGVVAGVELAFAQPAGGASGVTMLDGEGCYELNVVSSAPTTYSLTLPAIAE